MATITRSTLFTEETLNKYAILDREEFDRRSTLAMKALGASAVAYWRDIAKTRFSANTFKRYLEGMVVESSDEKISFSVSPNTVASLLEGGMDPMENFGSYHFVRSANKKRVIPLDPFKKRRYENYPRQQFFESGTLKSMSDIRFSMLGETDKDLVADVEYNLKAFSKTSAAHSYNTGATRYFNDVSDGHFVTLKPSDTWKHPGIREALLTNQLGLWMDMVKETFTEHLFAGDAEIDLG